jgi:hypothetical protein
MTIPSTTERYCINCDADRQVHIETGRCQTCGRVAVRGDAAEAVRAQAAVRAASINGNGHMAHGTAAPDKLMLPETAELRQWVSLTERVAGRLKERADRSAGLAKQFDAEATQFKRAASAFAGLLSQVGIEPKGQAAMPDGQPPTKRSGSQLNGRWSMSYEACVDCGRTDRKHAARGRCQACDWTYRQKGPKA